MFKNNIGHVSVAYVAHLSVRLIRKAYIGSWGSNLHLKYFLLLDWGCIESNSLFCWKNDFASKIKSGTKTFTYNCSLQLLFHNLRTHSLDESSIFEIDISAITMGILPFHWELFLNMAELQICLKRCL